MQPDQLTSRLRRIQQALGVQADGGARLAVASVTVRAARSDAQAAPLRHRATLWMERREGGWQVIAFDVAQGPLGDAGKKDAKKGKRK